MTYILQLSLEAILQLSKVTQKLPYRDTAGSFWHFGWNSARVEMALLLQHRQGLLVPQAGRAQWFTTGREHVTVNRT